MYVESRQGQRNLRHSLREERTPEGSCLDVFRAIQGQFSASKRFLRL